MKKGVNKNPSDPNYDLFKLACKCTAKRLYPNYANCDCSNQQSWIKQDRELKQNIIDNLTEEEYTRLQQYLYHNPEISNRLSIKLTDDCNQIYVDWTETPEELFSTMGCRTQTAADKAGAKSVQLNIEYMIKYQKPYDDVFSLALKDGRGNCCPATIIMPTIAMEAKELVKKVERGEYRLEADIYTTNMSTVTIASNDGLLVPDIEDLFIDLLDKAIHETKDGLIERYNWICSQSADSARFAYKNHLMAGYRPEEKIESAMRHFSLAIGQIGLAETLQILIGCD